MPPVSEGGIPFVCGGFFYDDCYKYAPEIDEWVSSGTLSEDRAYSGYGSSESWGLVMAGGSSTVRLGSVETTFDGETFATLPDIPIENREFCLVVIDDDRIFTCGGRWTPTDTLIFTKSTGSWTR